MSFGYGFSLPGWYATSGGFTPAQLFTGGVQGAWYDPSDVAIGWRYNLLTYTEQFENAAWVKGGNSFIQTNLLTWSEQFDNAAWTKLNTTITANSTTAPDSTTTADTLVETAAAGVHRVSQSFTPAVATYTTSVYAKASARTWLAIQNDFGSNNTSQFFDLGSGALGSLSGLGGTATITSVGNGWYRCTLTTTTTTTTAGAINIYVTTGNGVLSYTGDGTSGIYLWGAQLVQGATAGNYQVTTSAAAAVQYLAPNGTTTADKLVSAATTSQQRISFDSQATFTANTYTLTVYAKAAEWNFCGVTLYDGSVYYGAIFSLVDGSTSFVQPNTTVSATSVGNGWWRLAITATTAATLAPANQASGFWPRPAIPTSQIQQSITGDGTSGIYLWGAQLQLGSTATTYQQIVTPEISYLNYDADPILYQDSAGTTPVWAVEQPVGLMLDKSQGLVLGPELVTNGDFSQGTTGWSSVSSATLSISNGSLRATYGGSAFGGAETSISVTAGKWYRIQYQLTEYSGGGNLFVIVSAGTGGGGTRSITQDIGDSLGPYSVTFLAATSGTVYLGISAAGGGMSVGGYFAIDNVSVKSIPGNHAYQTTSASRPTLRARYNLLTYSEQFENAYWLKSNSSISANVAVAPDGTTTGDKLVENTANNQHWVGSPTGVALVSGASYTVSVYAKQGERGYIKLYGDAGNGSLGLGATFNLTNGTIFFTAVGATASITSVGNGWYRCVVTSTATGSTNLYPYVGLRQDSNPSADAYIGDGTSGAFIWGLQAVPTAVFPSNTYQRIAAATDYATGAAFPPYLFFDGTDDSMLTNSVDFATVTSDGQARRNLLTLPTEFNVTPPWTIAAGVTVTPNVDTAPDGTLSADRIVFTGVSQDVYQELTLANTQYVGSYYVKAGSAGEIGKTIAIGIGNSTNGFTDQLITLTANWQRITATRNVNSGTTCRVGVHTYAGATALNVIVWGAQLETGSTATAFQNIGTDKMLVVAGVTKNSDAARGCVAELGNLGTPTTGSWFINAPLNGTANDYSFSSGGTTAVSATYTNASVAAPTTNVLSGIGNIGAPVATLRVNGTQVASNTATQGTGNYGNYPLYIGRRNNASLPFNGYLFNMIIAGQSYSAGQISSTESYVAAKTPLGTI